MAFLVKGIPLILQKIFAPLLGVVLAAWFIMLLVSVISGKRHSCRFTNVASPRRWSVWTGLAVLAIVCTTLCGKNTNGVQNVGGGHLFQFNPPLVQIVTPQDVSNGWRVAEETEAESFAQPSASAITNELWRRRGAFDDALRIPANGWSYPYASGITVLSRGELRTCIRAHDFPRAFAQDISLLPFVNWSLLPEGRRESIFWYGTTSSNTLLTTWWNAALGRDATNPVNFQAELYPDGGFTYSYEDRTVRHARVWPFDWDNDGLENTVDPEPCVAGPDAHGTNAEWYNTVCSNVLEATTELSWRAGVNTNAYYFVDVVTTNGPAPIYFIGDRESRLGNPVVVALAGVTNHVPLLIGIDYSITSPVPFTVSYPTEYMYPELETNEPCRAHIRWPLDFSLALDGNGGYYLCAIPFDPGGVFQWESSDGGGGMRSMPLRSSACGYTADGDWLGFTCTGFDCGCGGCSVDGSYMLEGSTFNLPTLFCGCTPDSSGGPIEPQAFEPSVNITFSVPAVIFEDRYEASPNNWVEKRSTTNTLTVSASGGTGGGTLILSASNLDCLRRQGGSVNLPREIVLGPFQLYSATFECEGAGDGGTASVSGIISGPNGSDSSSAQTSVVRVEIEREHDAPMNACLNRHDYGIGEFMRVCQYPFSPSITVSANDAKVSGGSLHRVEWGVSNVEHTLSFSLSGVQYVPLVTIKKPTGIEGYDAQTKTNGLPVGVAGGLLLVQRYKVLPLTVNFEGIKIEEVPCYDAIPPTGYFIYAPTNEFPRTHSSAAGAGELWMSIESGNCVKSSIRDRAGFEYEIYRMMPDGTTTTNTAYGWLGGSLIWKVPFGWVEFGASSSSQPVGRFAEDTRQITSITDTGDFKVEKLGHTAIRQINGTITLDGNPDDGVLDN